MFSKSCSPQQCWKESVLVHLMINHLFFFDHLIGKENCFKMSHQGDDSNKSEENKSSRPFTAYDVQKVRLDKLFANIVWSIFNNFMNKSFNKYYYFRINLSKYHKEMLRRKNQIHQISFEMLWVKMSPI